MEHIKGGFAFNERDEKLVNQQRSITAQINNNFIQVGATFLQMSGKNPYVTDWYRKKFRDTNLQAWIDDPEMRALNLGFNLQFGWLDADIDAEDPRYNRCITKAFKYLGIDTRFMFGRLSKGVPSHIMVQLNEADLDNYDMLKEFEPNEFKLEGKRFKVELRSMGVISDDKANAIKESRQTVMPGSIYIHKTKAHEYDISVWYTESGQPAVSVGEVAATTSRKTSYSALITGVAFGTFLYIIQPHWIEGGRQQFTIKVAGWLARLVRESIGINENEGISRGTFCPINSAETAESMIDFICAELGDKEAYMRKRVLRDALKKLENNPDAKIPGWPSLEAEIGTEPMLALRTVFMPGVDVSPLTRMADRYIYDETDDNYIDRDRFYTIARFVHDGAELDRRHRNDLMEVAGKLKPVFKLFESSPLRRRVGGRDLYPDFSPGAIFRLSRAGGVIPDDQDAEPGTMTVFNTWRGWPILPTKHVDQSVIAKCNSMMDQLFAYLSQDNPVQVEWLKKWIAWTVQNPGQKQQVAPVFVGGQGVGKSFFGNIFLEQLFQNQWGSASPKILEGAFSVEPFINKMFVFIDEAKFYNETSTDEIKKLIRADRIGGAEKFQSARTYRIFARVIFASNRFDMNIGQANTQDRALFYMKTYDKDYKKQTDIEFRNWTVTLKPFFDEFNTFIRDMTVKEHYMYIFNTLEVSRHEIENTSISSSSDSHIIESNMSYARRVAKHIIEEGRIWEDLDISAPFTISEFNKRVADTCTSMGVRFVQPRYVLEEFTGAGLIEAWTSGTNKFWRFKYKIGTLAEIMGDSIGVKLEPRFVFTEDDFGENESTLIGAKPWKGGLNSRFTKGI
jgi:hypothetical protein